jgi:hypothetical protein
MEIDKYIQKGQREVRKEPLSEFKTPFEVSSSPSKLKPSLYNYNNKNFFDKGISKSKSKYNRR